MLFHIVNISLSENSVYGYKNELKCTTWLFCILIMQFKEMYECKSTADQRTYMVIKSWRSGIKIKNWYLNYYIVVEKYIVAFDFEWSKL